MTSLGLAAPLVLALVLILSGGAKLRSPRAAADSFISLRLPARLANSVAPRLLPHAELLLAVALLVLPGVAGILAAAVTAVLMLVYLVVIIRALGFDEPVECHCFGELGLGDVDRRTAVRNGLLVAFAAAALAAAIIDERSPVHRWWQAGPTHWGWLLISAALVALVVLILGRTAQTQAAQTPSSADQELLDYQRQPTPFAELITADGQTVRVRELARQQAQLLLFVNAHCGPCLRVTERIDEWRQALGPAVAVQPIYASTGPEALNQSDPRVAAVATTALYDPERHLAILLEAHGSPSAVLLGADDLLAGGPVHGESDVVAFVEEIRAELTMATDD